MRRFLIPSLLLILFGVIFFFYGAAALRGRYAGAPGSTNVSPASPPAIIPPPARAGDPIRGNPGAPNTIIEYGDFSCDSCKTAEPALRNLLATRADVRLIWRDLPLADKNPFSDRAAAAARCAQDQKKFWEYHDMLLQRTDLLVDAVLLQIAAETELDQSRFAACLAEDRASAIRAQAAIDAERLGLRGAPELFFNGLRYDGPLTPEGLGAALAHPAP